MKFQQVKGLLYWFENFFYMLCLNTDSKRTQSKSLKICYHHKLHRLYTATLIAHLRFPTQKRLLLMKLLPCLRLKKMKTQPGLVVDQGHCCTFSTEAVQSHTTSLQLRVKLTRANCLLKETWYLTTIHPNGMASGGIFWVMKWQGIYPPI